jgi:hypothetical protein
VPTVNVTVVDPLVLMAVVAMVANFSFAQTKIDFTQQAATLKDKVGYTLTAEGYTFEADKAAGTTVPTQNTNSKDLRHYAKNTLTISGPAMKEIVFTMSAAGKKQWGDVTPSEGQVTVDTENGITTWTNTNGSTTVTFTVGTDNTHGSSKKKTAAQFDLASVTISGDAAGKTKQPAKLAFSETTIDHEVGTEFTAPTFTKETTAAVTFVSDNEAVATVNAEGVIALGGEEGKAVITASSEENDAYSAGNATCTVYVWHYNVYKKAAAVESGKQYLIVAQRDGKTYYAIPAKESSNYGYLSTFNEYNAKCRWEPVHLHKACWVESDDEAELDQFKKRKYQYMAKDRDGRDVFLADSGYVLSMAQQDFKHIKFHFTSEF